MQFTSKQIGLIKHMLGLKYSHLRIIAYFTTPEAPINHNRLTRFLQKEDHADEAAHPTATAQEFQDFIADGRGIGPQDAGLRTVGRLEPHVFQYSFFPVGQGLFTSGVVTRTNQSPFQWVYDCGTEHGDRTRPRRRVLRQINTLRGVSDEFLTGSRHLNLAGISHFDQDHISGLLDLLKHYTVGTLLLPYLKPWQRLEIALEANVASDSAFLRFLIAPADYLLAEARGRISRVILVLPSGEAQPGGPLLPGEPRGPDDREEDIVFKPVVDADAASDYAPDNAGKSAPEIAVLPPGGTITVPRLWEFVPYNDADLAGAASPAFRSAVVVELDALRKGDEATRKSALGRLRTLYDAQFKTPTAAKIDDRRRNLISMFLYSGPVGRARLVDQYELRLRRRRLIWCTGSTSCGVRGHRFSQLMTGDGYLRNARQLTALTSFYTPHDRLHRTALLQVMHHGSRSNWHEGVAAAIDPQMSVFSSSPDRKGWRHPHFEVVRDFVDHHPIQVDERDGWAWRGMFVFDGA